MNSKIYCLPQKLGWNSVTETSVERAQRLEEYLNRQTSRPFYTVQFPGEIPSKEARREFQRQYPRLPVPDADTNAQALKSIFTTQYAFEYGLDFIPPMIRPPPPITYEKRANPAKDPCRTYYTPLATLNPPLGSFSNDPDRGLHQWRELKVRPDFGIWQSYARQPFQTYVGERSTLPPVRLKNHDPTHEKERWDNIRNLIRQNAVNYGYRVDVTGYTGRKQQEEHIFSEVEKDISHPNEAMVPTTQAIHKEFPAEHYMHLENQAINKHQGPLSRMVTLTHPHNSVIQQSACCNMGATNMH